MNKLFRSLCQLHLMVGVAKRIFERDEPKQVLGIQCEERFVALPAWCCFIKS